MVWKLPEHVNLADELPWSLPAHLNLETFVSPEYLRSPEHQPHVWPKAGRAAMHDEQLAYGLHGSDGARPSLASVRCSLRRGGFFSSVALISSISSRTRTAASAETAARWTVTGSGEGRWNLQ